VQATEKEEFRHYLENSGVIDALTKVLVGLYEENEKPQNPLELSPSFITLVSIFVSVSL